MAYQPETGDVGAGVDPADLAGGERGRAVEREHGLDGGGDVLGGGRFALEGGRHDSGAEGLGEKETVARERSRFGQDALWMDRAGDAEAILRLVVGDGMSAGDHRAGLGDLAGAPLKDRGQQVGGQVFGESGDVERQQDIATHGVDVAHAVRRRDRAVGPGIVDDRGEEVDRLNDRQLGRELVDRRVVAGLQTNQEVRVGALGERAQNLR